MKQKPKGLNEDFIKSRKYGISYVTPYEFDEGNRPSIRGSWDEVLTCLYYCVSRCSTTNLHTFSALMSHIHYQIYILNR